MRHSIVLLYTIVALLLMGCAATLPHSFAANESYLTHPDDYTVIGQVEGKGSVMSVLGFPPTGDAGLRAAMQDAMRGAGADGLINVVADVTVNNMFLFYTYTTTVRALAIKKK